MRLFRFLAFARRHRMLSARYALLYWRYLWRRYLTVSGWRMQTDGPVFFGRGLQIQVARGARLRLGRFVWVGDGTKIRCHQGEVAIGPKTILGQECTISAYRHVRIGEQCVVADRAMFIDFDHGMVEVERPIRLQGIYMRNVDVGSNVWIGYGACVLRGVQVGDNSVLGTYSVVTRDVPANAVVGGVPARLIRMREAPRDLSWPAPVDPHPPPVPPPARDTEAAADPARPTGPGQLPRSPSALELAQRQGSLGSVMPRGRPPGQEEER